MASGERWIAGGRLAGGGEIALRVQEGRIVATAAAAPRNAEVIDLRGHWIAPFAVDAHVHLAFAAGLGATAASDHKNVQAKLSQVAEAMLAGGVSGVIDLGAPQALLGDLSALRSSSTKANFALAFAGPLLCAPRGYPTQSWGSDGYGLAVSTAEEAKAAVETLHGAGARFAKLALDHRYPQLSPAAARAIVLEAKKLGMLSAAHALDAAAVQAALDAGVDILAHTPVERLPDAIVREAGARKLVVISTLVAFGSEESARENLARLSAAGCHVNYGTDLGNEGTSPGLSEPELRGLSECGFSCAQILAMCTRDAADLLGDEHLGRLQPGSPAHLLVLAEDPLRDPVALCRPAKRFISGVEKNCLEHP